MGAKKNENSIGVAATITVHRIPDMTPAGRRSVFLWLTNVGRDILWNPKEYGRRFTARYYYKKGA